MILLLLSSSMAPQVRFGKCFSVTCADVFPEELGPLQRQLPGWIQKWLEHYLPTVGSVNPFFVTGFFLPLNDPSRFKFIFTVGGVDFEAPDRQFVNRAFTLANRLDDDLKAFLRLHFGHQMYAWCLPQFNQFEFN